MSSPAHLPPDLPLHGAALADVLGSTLPMLVALQGGLLSVKDAVTGRYAHVSGAMAALLGRPADQICGRTDADIFDAGLAGAFRAAEQTARAQGAPLLSEHEFELAGSRRTFNVLRTLYSNGGPSWLVAVWLDRALDLQRAQQLRSALEQIEQQQLAHDRLRRELTDQALRDPASGLHRRGHFEDQLRREVDLSSREHREFALVAVTLDAPSEAARAIGGESRASVQEAFGRLLTGNTRVMDSSCRLSEDRFAVLLSGVGLATAHTRMESLRRQCATQIVVHRGQPLGFTLSMGIASFPHTAQTQPELSDAADAAMREALRRGGNQVTLAGIRFESA